MTPPNDLAPTSPRPRPTPGGDLDNLTSPHGPLPYGGRGQTEPQGATSKTPPPPRPRGEVALDTPIPCLECGGYQASGHHFATLEAASRHLVAPVEADRG